MRKEQINQKFNKDEVLNLLKISSATLDNWIRTSIPQAYSNNLYDMEVIKDFISSQNKLEKRANKKKNKTIEFPVELVKYLVNKNWINDYISYIEDKPKEHVASQIIDLYKKRLNKQNVSSELSEIIPHSELYSYSVAYQILLDAGDKSKTGAYYTPMFIIKDVLNDLVAKGKKFLEPSCGVGFYVIEYIKKYKEMFGEYPEGLVYANEIDNNSAEITRLNIINVTNNELKNFIVTSKDALLLDYNDIDLVITNPPYGIKNKYSEMKTTEIFSHFIHKSLSIFLKNDGILNFVLPSSILNVEKHSEIRKYILNNFVVQSIKSFGKSFDGVFSDIIYIQIKKREDSKNIVKVITDGTKAIAQKSFIKNKFMMNYINEEDEKQIEQYYSLKHVTLKEATFALGIVTGNNSFFIKNEQNEQGSLKEIISGKEVVKGEIVYTNKKYIIDDIQKYQQKPDMSLFTRKKIVYKFISKNIVTAVDNFGILTLNSANLIVLNPDLEKLSEEYISALLNSEVVNKIYQLKFGNQIKVLKKSLQDLPIFIFNEDIQKKIVENYKMNEHEKNDIIINYELSLLIKH